MNLIERRIRRIEDVLGGNGARYVVCAAPKEDTPDEIDIAIKRAATAMGVSIESVDAAWLFLPHDFREHLINPRADVGRLSDMGVMKDLLEIIPPSTGLPDSENCRG